MSDPAPDDQRLSGLRAALHHPDPAVRAAAATDLTELLPDSSETLTGRAAGGSGPLLRAVEAVAAGATIVVLVAVAVFVVAVVVLLLADVIF